MYVKLRKTVNIVRNQNAKVINAMQVKGKMGLVCWGK